MVFIGFLRCAGVSAGDGVAGGTAAHPDAVWIVATLPELRPVFQAFNAAMWRTKGRRLVGEVAGG